MKIIAILLSIFASHFCFAQDKIPTQEEAEAFFEKEDKSGFLFHTVTEEDELFGLYANRQPGDVIISGTTIYQVVNVKKVHIINFGSIQLEQTLSTEQVAEIQKKIIEKYNAGVPFVELIREYSETKASASESAVLEWPLENFNQKRKELFVKHKEGEIFAYNDPNNNEYRLYIKNSLSIPRKVAYVFEAKYQ
jgi:hypothetical protein